MSLLDPKIVSALVLALTIAINVGLAYTGTTAKLVCTVEQTQAAAAAILALPAATSTQQ